MKKPLRIGVIGVGGRGMIADYAHHPDGLSVITAGADINPTALAAFRDRMSTPVRLTEDYRELLSWTDIDAVIIASPDPFHEQHAVDALNARKAVYLEKPMAITIEGCDRILRAARDNHARLYVGHNMRHMPFTLKMKQLIDEGRIGQVKAIWCRHFISYGGEAYFKDWHAERRNTTSLLLQKGAHDLDVIHWLGGAYSTRVNAMGGLTLYGDVTDRRKAHEPPAIRSVPDLWPPTAQTGLNPVIDVEDLSTVQIRLANGVFATYMQCHYTPDAWRNYTVIGTQGRIENFGDYSGDVTIRLWNRPPHFNPDGDERFELHCDPQQHGGADPQIIAEFVRFASGQGTCSISPVAARYSVATGCVATESLRNAGQALPVPSVSDDLSNYFSQGQCKAQRTM